MSGVGVWKFGLKASVTLVHLLRYGACLGGLFGWWPGVESHEGCVSVGSRVDEGTHSSVCCSCFALMQFAVGVRV